mgnify:CR=1 FL=1
MKETEIKLLEVYDKLIKLNLKISLKYLNRYSYFIKEKKNKLLNKYELQRRIMII